MKRGFLLLFLVATFLGTSFAKEPTTGPSNYVIDFSKYDFIDSTLNIIQFPGGRDSFEPFFQKMDSLVFENKGKVNILHIGGSHIQADVVSGRIREHLIENIRVLPPVAASCSRIPPHAPTRLPATVPSTRACGT